MEARQHIEFDANSEINAGAKWEGVQWVDGCSARAVTPLRSRKAAVDRVRCPWHGTPTLEKGHDRRGAVLATGERGGRERHGHGRE
jgi:hypothetical protein